MQLLHHYLCGRGRRGWYGYNQFFLVLLLVRFRIVVVSVVVVMVVTVVHVSYWFIITGGAHKWRLLLLGGRGRSSGVLLIMAGVVILVF